MTIRFLKYLVVWYHLFCTINAYCYQLVSIKSISSSKKTFIINLGKRDEIYLNKVATFSTELISFEAIVVEVSRDFSQSKILEEHAHVPVPADSIIVMHSKGLGKLDSLAGSIDYENQLEETILPKQTLSVSAVYAYGFNQSISQTNSQEITSRSSNYYQFDYNKKIYKYFYLGLSYRYEAQRIYAPTYISDTTRNFILGHAILLFHPNLNGKWQYLTIQIGTTIGAGLSSTSIANTKQSGYALIVPTLDLGLSYNLNQQFALQLRSSIESITAKETLQNASIQNISEINVTFGVGPLISF